MRASGSMNRGMEAPGATARNAALLNVAVIGGVAAVSAKPSAAAPRPGWPR